MSIIDNVLFYLEENCLKQSDLCNHIGINTSTMTNWKNRKTDPPAKYIIPICEFLGVSPYVLLTGKEKNSPAANLSDDEQKLLTYYKQLSDIEKGIVIGRAEQLAADSERDLNEPESTMFIEYYSLPVSAGTGVDLDGCKKGMLEVEETQLTLQANFALRVFGISMEPVFHNGDVVLVASQPSVEIGEIGIFILNGEGFIKKFGGDRLISLNPDYDDIPLHDYDSIYCRGKVIGSV